MTAAGGLRGELAGPALRWGACFLLVLGLHAGLAVALLRRAPRPELPASVPDAVMVELAPEAVPQPEATPVPDPMPVPEPKPPEAPTPPEPTPPAPPLPEPPPVEPPAATEPPPPPEPVVPPIPAVPPPTVALPEPPPAPKRPPPPRPARPPRPAPASPPRPVPEAEAPRAAPAPAPPPPSAPAAPSSSALPGWRSELASRLQRAKRYPDLARAREEQGAAAVTFTLDRSGHVLSVKLVRSSGSASLDEEAVALVRRADPLPPMPAEMAGSTAIITQSFTFSLR